MIPHWVLYSKNIVVYTMRMWPRQNSDKLVSDDDVLKEKLNDELINLISTLILAGQNGCILQLLYDFTLWQEFLE